MRIDWDLIRTILLKAEAAPANRMVGTIEVEGYDEDVVLEHLELLVEKGLLDGEVKRTSTGGGRIMIAFVRKVTWEGHQFLEKARNEQVWNQTKEIVKEKGGSASFEVIKAVLTQVALRYFGVG